MLQRLAVLRQAIRAMPLLPWFEERLVTRCREVLGGEPGEIRVFVRSDSNMEGLRDFTGAGLNLTVPNVADAGALRQAIRDVWALPFTERSYGWRQKLLLNPATAVRTGCCRRRGSCASPPCRTRAGSCAAEPTSTPPS